VQSDDNLRNQSQMERHGPGKRVVQAPKFAWEIGGVWMRPGLRPEVATLTVKAQSDAYFRLLEKQAAAQGSLSRLGNIWYGSRRTAPRSSSTRPRAKKS